MLGLTMRMERKKYPGGHIELRDAVATDWPRFLAQALPGMPYVLLPNIGVDIIAHAAKLGVDAFIFTGGEDWGVCPLRDETERALFKWGREREMPIFGVCRGAQVINILLGGQLHPCAAHVGCHHKVHLQSGFGVTKRVEVNSFHGQCIASDELACELKAFAVADDKCVEGFIGVTDNICGVMWHPEREKVPHWIDLELIRRCFGERLNG